MLQTPKVTIEVKDLRVDISKDGGSKPTLFVKLQVLPLVVHVGDPQLGCDQSSNFNHGSVSAGQSSFLMMERSSAPFYCEEFSISCGFGHNR